MSTSTSALDLRGIRGSFISKDAPGRRCTAVRDVSLTSVGVGGGEFMSVVGPTGCGKSTLLKVAAGPANSPSIRHARATRPRCAPARVSSSCPAPSGTCCAKRC